MTTTDEEIPKTMKRLVVTSPGNDVASCKIEIQEVPVPEPTNGQVLIKVCAAAINPSDYGNWKTTRPEHCPAPMGKEGCGTVVKVSAGGGSGANLLKKWFMQPAVGKKVGFCGLDKTQGTYSEYITTADCFPLPDDVPLEDAASFFVNPYTALGIFDTVRQEKSPAVVHTAAASQLGQMMVKLAPSEGVELINVVRREEQAEVLKKIGAKHVIVTDKEEWKTELKEKVKDLGATCAFDAVAGTSTADLLEALPKRGTVFVYGGLAGKVQDINPMSLIYHEKQIKGFFLSSWVQSGGALGMVPRLLAASRKVNSGLKDGGWSSSQFKDTTLEKAQEDTVELLKTKATGQKLRIRFE